MKHTVDVMISREEIATRIAELGKQISEAYRDSCSEMVLVGLLRGSFMFMADLCREIDVPHEVDFMTASSYGSGMSTMSDNVPLVMAKTIQTIKEATGVDIAEIMKAESYDAKVTKNVNVTGLEKEEVRASAAAAVAAKAVAAK